MQTDPKHPGGPTLHAVHPWIAGNPQIGSRHQLLSDRERAQLARISSIVRFKKGQRIYNERDKADAVFNIVSGIVTIYRELSERRHIAAFLYPGDICGLSEEGCYMNACEAATHVVAYKMPMHAMRRLLAKNPDLDVDVIVKLCEELRQAQRHGLLLSQKKAVSKLAMFLDLQQHLQALGAKPVSEVYLPMKRSDISAYLGLTLPAVSRAFRTLVTKKVISFRDRHHARILDRVAFEKIADSPDQQEEGSRDKQAPRVGTSSN
jgi:CRP-like cAMP-binding protein